jgi:beta-galactosidase
MNKITTKIALLLCIISVLFSGIVTAGNNETKPSKIDFNRGWAFVKSIADWPVDFEKENNALEPVHLPHTWNADDMVVGSSTPYEGVAWYRKNFIAPSMAEGQRLLLEFEGVTNCHKVWVNGGYAGGRNGGFLPTLMDITDLLEEGENTILVRVDSRFEITAAMPANIDWNRYGGITRPVWMHVREHAYLTSAGVEIRTPEVTKEKASTLVQVHVQEESLSGSELQIRHTLIEPDGDIISTITNSLNTAYSRTNTIETELPLVSNPELWSDTRPVLYTLKTEVIEGGEVIDQREDRIGYRFFHFDADEGFVLNGKPTQLRGANIHIFYPGLGNAVPERFHRSEMELMKEMGCNFMRTSHYPRPKACLDVCDELGILVMEEQPYWHGSVRASYGEAAIDNAPRLINDMVRHHRNHPSIIAWNTVNEVMIAPFYQIGTGHLEPNDPRREAWMINAKEYPYIRRHLQKMVDAFKEADPDRPVSMVVGGAWKKNDAAHLTSVADIVAYNGGAMSFGSEFKDSETGKVYDFQPDYYREHYPQHIHLMSEGVLNIFTYERGEWEQEDKAWRKSAECWNQMGARPWFAGGSMWCFTDYSANGILRLHGVVDRHRLKKDLFYFYEAMWADHPVMHIMGHWNHITGSSQDIVVFTNCSDVELTLNGKSLGKGISCAADYPEIDNPPLVWKNVSFKKGKLEAKGKYGNQQLTDSRITAGKPVQIKLRASNDLISNGRDISYIDITLCDKKGNRCYTAEQELTVKVNGPATLAGSEKVQVNGGLARVAIRSNGELGELTISASGINTAGDKLKNDAEVTLWK